MNASDPNSHSPVRRGGVGRLGCRAELSRSKEISRYFIKMNATALHETNGKVFVVCPHCTSVHAHDSTTTPRLIEIPALCDDAKKYTIGSTMKPKNFIAAIHLYEYELERKRKQYRRKKSSTTSTSESD
jgi:hypothetical protein